MAGSVANHREAVLAQSAVQHATDVKHNHNTMARSEEPPPTARRPPQRQPAVGLAGRAGRGP